MESNDLTKSNLLKINFGRNSKNFSFGIQKLLFYFLFIKICILIYLFILIKYGLNRQKDSFKEIISLFKKYLSKNGTLLATTKNEIEEKEIYFDKYEIDMI
jgi:hypothetical protein